MVAWKKSMACKGLHPAITVSHQMYNKDSSLPKVAMGDIEARVKRLAPLPQPGVGTATWSRTPFGDQSGA